MAVLLREPEAASCIRALAGAEAAVISAATLAEALVVPGRRDVGAEMAELVDELGIEIVPVDEEAARRVGRVYARWGKGVHPAGLNFADCFAYDIAASRDCPLLYIGRDFARTDIRAAL